MKNLNMILAVAEGTGAIGNKGKLPWHCPEDLEYFKSKVTGCPVIVSRATWDSLPQSVKDIVDDAAIITQNPKHDCPEKTEGGFFLYWKSVDKDMRLLGDDFLEGCPAHWIIGGGPLYEAFAKYCDEIHMSVIHEDVEFDRAVDCEKIIEGRELRSCKSLSPKAHVGVWV